MCRTHSIQKKNVGAAHNTIELRTPAGKLGKAWVGALEMQGLPALPLEVRQSQQIASHMAEVPYICLMNLMVPTKLQICMLAAITLLCNACATPRTCPQVLASVVAKLPRCKGVQLQRMSQ